MINFLRTALLNAYKKTLGLGEEGGEIISRGTRFGDLKNDTEIYADKVIGRAIIDFFKRTKVNCLLEVEGQKAVTIGKGTPKYCIFVDPLDGSLNYKNKKETIGLPFSCVITVFPYNSSLKFKHAETAGCIDLRSQDLWLAEKGMGCRLNNRACQTSGAKEIDIGNGIIIGEFYYPENRELLCKIFEKEKGSLRNLGSAAYEMALVASGQVDAYICASQKNHELGAAYLLVKEAGGTAVDFEGNDLGERKYIFNEQTPVVLAATQKLADKILEKIKTVRGGKNA